MATVCTLNESPALSTDLSVTAIKAHLSYEARRFRLLPPKPFLSLSDLFLFIPAVDGCHNCVVSRGRLRSISRVVDARYLFSSFSVGFCRVLGVIDRHRGNERLNFEVSKRDRLSWFFFNSDKVRALLSRGSGQAGR